MAKYTFDCNMGHDPDILEVEAENDDEALTQMREKAKAHLAEKHAGEPLMGDAELDNMIQGGWKKED